MIIALPHHLGQQLPGEIASSEWRTTRYCFRTGSLRTDDAGSSRVTTPANNIDLELTEDELDHVVGGNSAKKPSASEFVTFKMSTFSGSSGSKLRPNGAPP